MKKILLIMIICLFGISNDLFAQATCDDVNITISDATANNVLNGQTDNRHAEVTLTAANDIENGGTAHYKAGTSITLGPGFHAKAGSQFTASIEACTLGAFIGKWKTNIVDPLNKTLVIPGFSDTSYTVDWGDSTITQETAYATHIYSNPGEYTIKITGDLDKIQYFENTLNGQITKIEKWGSINWESMYGAFAGNSSLTIDQNAGEPDLSSVTSMARMFHLCSNLDSSTLNDWNVSNVTNMDFLFSDATAFDKSLDNWIVNNVTSMNNMFDGASSFSYSLGSWDVSNVTSMNSMLDNTNLGSEDYANTLIDWNNLSSLQSNVTLGAAGLKYCSTATAARNNLIGASSWVITDDGVSGTCRSAGSNPRVAIDKPNTIFVYPNPASDKINIQHGNNSLADIAIEIMDVSGRVLLRKKGENKIDIRSLKRGIYLIQIISKDQKQTMRFIKE